MKKVYINLALEQDEHRVIVTAIDDQGQPTEVLILLWLLEKFGGGVSLAPWTYTSQAVMTSNKFSPPDIESFSQAVRTVDGVAVVNIKSLGPRDGFQPNSLAVQINNAMHGDGVPSYIPVLSNACVLLEPPPFVP